MPLPPSLRIIFRNKTYSILNIVGLSIGLSIALLICLMVYNEQSFDKSFKESKNIYRMYSYLRAYTPGEIYATTSNQTGPYLQEEVPEIVTTVRTYPESYTIRLHNELMKFSIMWADEDFFRLFDTPFIQGSAEAVMKQPNAIAISESMAKQLFGKEDPMGQTISLINSNWNPDNYPVEVKAVYKDYPKNSSFYDYRVIGPFMHSYPDWFHAYLQWGNLDFETFCLLTENADATVVGQRVAAGAKKGMGDDAFYIPRLQKLQDIHLYSAKFNHSYTSFQSDIGKVKTLTLLAIVILLVACINYMNLSTARAQKRSKEIGVCKTLGAKRSGLILKLTMETGIITAISFLLAFALAFLLLPVFNDILQEQLSFSSVFHPVFLVGALLIWLVTTCVAASYPAIYLSSFPPLKAIRAESVNRGSGHAAVRKILTVGQFAVAIVLIAWVFIIQSQIRYANNKDIGYNPHHLVGFYAPESVSEALANEYRSLSSVEMVTRESSFLFNGNGNIILKDREDKTGLSLWTVRTDVNFIEVMQLKLIAGTRLPERASGDTVTQIILNRRAVEYLETTPEEIIGKEVLAEIGARSPVRVCGVVENFNFEPLYKPVTGYGIHNDATYCPLCIVMIRVKEGKMPELLSNAEQIFKKYAPNERFAPGFPDQQWEKMYEAEHRTNQVAICFSVLAIFVACMGVFGLTAFMAEQRTKEIGIRKVMGASIYDIVSLFTNSYLKLLLASLVIAIPVAWWLGNNYLNDFAYRISIAWWIFAVAALITIIITILTVCTQAVKAAMGNPVGAMRGE